MNATVNATDKTATTTATVLTTPGTRQVQALADISHSCYVDPATKPVHRSQIRPIVHNHRAPPTIPSYIRVCTVVWARGEGQTHTDTQM